MTTAAPARRKPARISLKEDIHRGKPGKVDREAGVIRGVKIIGLVSENGRRYTQEALRRAIPMYEGRVVRIDHPAKPNENRAVFSTFGRLTHVKEDPEGGLRGDLEFLKEHDAAAFICEMAERMPENFGLSHNAEGDGKTIDGIFWVNEIVSVRSVDLVSEPATTSGLFEHRQQSRKSPMKLKAYFEAIKGLDDKKKAGIKKLYEMDAYMDEAADVPGDMVTDSGEPTESDPDEALWQGFRTAMLAVLDGEGDAAGKMSKIGAMLKSHEKLKGGDEIEEEDVTGTSKSGGLDGDEKEKVATKEGCDDNADEKDKLKEEVRVLKAERAAYQLCEVKKITPSKPLIKALVALDNDTDRKALLESFPTPATNDRTGNKPRTQIPNGSRTGSLTVDSLVSSLKNGN